MQGLKCSGSQHVSKDAQQALRLQKEYMREQRELEDRPKKLADKIEALNAGKMPPPVVPGPRSEKCKRCASAPGIMEDASEDEDTDTQETLDLPEGEDPPDCFGLGLVFCPKTGKAACLSMYSQSYHGFCQFTCWLVALTQTQALTEAAVMQRVRRACQVRKSGKVPAGEESQKLWRDVENRNEMCKLLIEAGFKTAGASKLLSNRSLIELLIQHAHLLVLRPSSR